MFNSNGGPILTLNQYFYTTGLMIVIITLIIQLITSEVSQIKGDCNNLI